MNILGVRGNRLAYNELLFPILDKSIIPMAIGNRYSDITGWNKRLVVSK